jgi:hypothetical protein
VLLMSGMMSTVILGEYNVQNRSTGFWFHWESCKSLSLGIFTQCKLLM